MAVNVRKTNLKNISSPVVAGTTRWPLPLTELGGFNTYTDMEIPNNESRVRGFIAAKDGEFVGASKRLSTNDTFVDTITMHTGFLAQQNGAAIFVYGDEAIHIITDSANTTLSILPSPDYPIISQTLSYNHSTGMYSFLVGPYYEYDIDTRIVDNSQYISQLESAKTITCNKIQTTTAWDIYKMDTIPVMPSSFSFDTISPTNYHINFFNGLIYIDSAESTGDSFTATADVGILISYMPYGYITDTTTYDFTPATQRPTMGSLSVRS